MGLMPPKSAVTVAGCYDQALHYTRDHHLPPAAPRPRPTADWPPENLALLERYVAWLLEGGASPIATRGIYLPAAGHVLGLALKPHPQIDLEADFERVMAYTRGKGCGPDWLKATHNGLEKFRRFVRCERGLGETLAITPFDVAAHTQGLPAWLVTELERYQRTQQRNWRPARLDGAIPEIPGAQAARHHPALRQSPRPDRRERLFHRHAAHRDAPGHLGGAR
jgi:hypothetical protein